MFPFSCSFEFKPSALVTYSMGQQGGICACMALRPFLSELGCLPVKQMVTIPQVRRHFSSYYQRPLPLFSKAAEQGDIRFEYDKVRICFTMLKIS